MASAKGEDALKLARTFWKFIVDGKGFDQSLKKVIMAGKEFITALFKNASSFKGYNKILEKVVITSAGQGSCQAEFKVTEDMTNRGGSLHGGCTATLIDIISTIGLMTKSNNIPGVSVNMNINYLKAANEGEEVLIDSKTVKIGKKLAFLNVELKKKSTGEVIATGNHVKYVATE